MYKAFLFSILLFLASCLEESRFPGFLKSDTGYHYKFFSLGEGEAPKELDFISVAFTLREYHLGSGLADSAHKDVLTVQLLPGTSFTKAMMALNEGDSAAFVFNSSEINWVLKQETSENSFFQFDVKLLEVISRDKYLEKYRKLEKWLHKPRFYEEKLISEYIDKQKPDAFSDEIYYYHIKKGKGKEITDESVVTLKYTGYHLDGTAFDQANTPFLLDLKAEEQVIEGLKQAIKKMKKGGKAKIIIPSHLAFGEMGSSNGIIPPNAPVIYELEIIEVNK